VKKYLVATVMLLGIFGTAANATTTAGQNAGETRMSEFSATRPPVGYVQFCRQNPGDCNAAVVAPQRLTLSPARMQDLDEVNSLVNSAIAPVTDQELYGVAEMWTYPYDRGDCEDYVLLKRRLLMERGWPASALLITVVRDQKGDGHAVLTVATSAGDLVLDNQAADIRFWRDTPYEYLKRQSTSDPNRWVSLRSDDSRPQFSVGGTTPTR
jgi:predicted transglutaminase-like cysteine proteinase